jgi:hypothetical protein
VGIVLFGIFRPASPDPLDEVRARENWFYLYKTHHVGKYELVVVGDSRALRGIAPAEMATELPGMRVFNMAYNAGGFNPEMYAAAERRLVADGSQRAVLLAITPLALVTKKLSNSQYHEFLKKPWDERLFYLHALPVAEFLAPSPPSLLPRWILGIEPSYVSEETHHADGWIETTQHPPKPLDAYRTRQRLTSDSISPEVITMLLDQTRRWTIDGIRVFALQVPTCEDRIRMESEILGFDEESLRRDFERVGGIWLDSPLTNPVFYDCSHLERESAIEYSRALGRSIQETLNASAADDGV